ncbi:hypothetical protein [Xanthocytophaga agilis]|uniref:Uncharacterized protein n=1 Tax=Xanthocytophaga agilis TaxID=3048010 RepID=A0AAE3UJP1_9BACT|nr:hypothetical protein [Xanthocytophaga agilis]MDJ1506237.1 hypothetical protein [Xanthocytophaga agilis]
MSRVTQTLPEKTRFIFTEDWTVVVLGITIIALALAGLPLPVPTTSCQKWYYQTHEGRRIC